ncbi:MAG: site-2 protease family protein [Kiritimatiellia bacterium]|jgi:Zn-dependent protease
MEKILVKVVSIAALMLAVMIHEIAHGWVALRHGDTTARDAGRLSLNPLRHIDLVGTIILPLALVLVNAGVVFGWAKPVPVNIARCRNPRQAFWMTALAGPLSNLLQALLGTGLLLLVVHLVPRVVETFWGGVFVIFLYLYVFTNLVLMTFNLIPIPPLDGSKVLAMLLPDRLAIPYLRLDRIGFILIFLLLQFDVVDNLLQGVLQGYAKLFGLPL